MNKMRTIDFDYEYFTYDNLGRSVQSLPAGQKIQLESEENGDLVFRWRQFTFYYFAEMQVDRFPLDKYKRQMQNYAFKKLLEKNTIVTTEVIYERARAKYTKYFKTVEFTENIVGKKMMVENGSQTQGIEPLKMSQFQMLLGEIMQHTAIIEREVQQVKEQQALLDYLNSLF